VTASRESATKRRSRDDDAPVDASASSSAL
jgi:hypothetical protein